jgi:hypothetical protein
MGLSLMNMLGLSLSVYLGHIEYYFSKMLGPERNVMVYSESYYQPPPIYISNASNVFYLFILFF